MAADAFDLSKTFVHLGLGSAASPIPDFQWTADFLTTYEAAHEADGDDGRLVCITAHTTTWTTWERHPAGDEVVVMLSGRADMVQDLDGRQRVVAMTPGQAIINPAGVWHRSIVHEAGHALYITPGRGTEHRPVD